MDSLRFAADSERLTILLDDEKNLGQTVFTPGQTAHLRVYSGGLAPALRATGGSVRVTARRVRETIEEFAVFFRSDSFTLKRPGLRIVDYAWVSGGLAPALIMADGALALSAPFTGVCRVRYTAEFDRAEYTASQSVKAVVWAETEGRLGHIVLDFAGVDTPRLVNIVVKDACTREPVPGADVRVDGVRIGLTGVDGAVSAGLLGRGTHSLRITADGYKDSDKDVIRNDRFTLD